MSISSLKSRIKKIVCTDKTSSIDWYIKRRMHRLTGNEKAYPMPTGTPPPIKGIDGMGERIQARMDKLKKMASSV